MQHSVLYESIESMRQQLGKKLSIVAHHYQHESVIRHADLRGDSLELARRVAALDSAHIIFCGVYFMAESAALLARSGQTVYLPEPSAECVMAKMSPVPHLEAVMKQLREMGKRIIPVTYVNSTLEVKAFVGLYGGSVCTSANAEKILSWALQEGDAVFFMPDRNLGANTANKLGIKAFDQYILELRGKNSPMNLTALQHAKVLLWPGGCPIHTRFSPRQIERLRDEHRGIRIIVHPECTPEVVAAADAAGSTSFIINYVGDAPKGSIIAIGTELNLVERLAKDYAGRVKIMPLVESECTHMAQTTEERLEATLNDIVRGNKNFAIQAPEALKNSAKAALERMLTICA